MSSDSVPSVLGGLPEWIPSVSLGPEYSIVDNIKIPSDVGVRSDDTIDSVMDAINGVNYYIDTIAFGKNVRSRQDDMKPLGVRTWMKTGQKCSNGADMWSYINLIPEGNALGEKAGQAFSAQGIPLKGLAPGILEDSKEIFNPMGIASSLFGTGFAKCKRSGKIVGDQDNKIERSILEKGGKPGTVSYVNKDDIQFVTKENREDPITGTKNDFHVLYKWEFDEGITQSEFDSAAKTHCPDGFPISAHINSDCNKTVLKSQIKEPFTNYLDKNPFTLQTKILGVLAIGGVFILGYKLKNRK